MFRIILLATTAATLALAAPATPADRADFEIRACLADVGDKTMPLADLAVYVAACKCAGPAIAAAEALDGHSHRHDVEINAACAARAINATPETAFRDLPAGVTVTP